MTNDRRAMRAAPVISAQSKTMKAVYYRNRTGLCPMCGTRPAKRLTCGHNDCMDKWLPGGHTVTDAVEEAPDA